MTDTDALTVYLRQFERIKDDWDDRKYAEIERDCLAALAALPPYAGDRAGHLRVHLRHRARTCTHRHRHLFLKEGIVMANGSVVVHDIDSLEKFGMELAARSAELESLYNALTVSCAAQETNWHDPQYDLLHERVELYAGEARAQLLALNDAVQYISVLAAKLRAL